MAKLRVGLIYGGRSVEHEVSVISANSILRNLDPSRYEVWPIAVDHAGRWWLGEPGTALEATLERGVAVTLPAAPTAPALHPIESVERGEGRASSTLSTPFPVGLDLIFPIIHGRGGEDGCLQGLLELVGLPYVGSGVLGSALQMDKETSKRLLAAAELPVVPWVGVEKSAVRADPRAAARRVADQLGMPLFVKPANSGSSVGIARVERVEALGRALAEAFRYDTKVIAEQGLDAREIEVAVLGNDTPEASVPGEIIPTRDWYDYEAKYLDEGTELLVPAPLEPAQAEIVRDLAVRAYRVLEGAGLGRVDFLLERRSGTFFVGEVNSLPGFTEVSMYPQLWEASGLPYPQLLDRLIELALERHRERATLETQHRRG